MREEREGERGDGGWERGGRMGEGREGERGEGG